MLDSEPFRIHLERQDVASLCTKARNSKWAEDMFQARSLTHGLLEASSVFCMSMWLRTQPHDSY